MFAVEIRALIALLSLLTLSLGGKSRVQESTASAPGLGLETVSSNDNRRPAGALAAGTLTLALRAGAGLWRPEGLDGPALRIEAFGEDGGSLSAPAPLIRVPEGTRISVSVRNELDSTLTVHGLCARDGTACTSLVVPPAESREVLFAAGRPGTYHYWATTTGMPLALRGSRDTQLSGAFVVDAPGAAPDADRIFVITEWTSLTPSELGDLARADDVGAAFRRINPRFTFLINGLSWPATERLTYRMGESVRWRVVNLSTQWHPMHLHGFYYEIDALGDGMVDAPASAGSARRVVTQLMRPGNTMAMTWTPERQGNWLFHCHIMEHVSPKRRLALGDQAPADHTAGGHDASVGMAGMILGITVLGPASDVTASARAYASARKLTLTMRSEPKPDGGGRVYGFSLSEGSDSVSSDPVSVPGPPLVLRRGEPVEIALVNHLPEGTAIHWHGMELESYYDGVHGWSGTCQRVTPIIGPGGTFVVRFTPPRAGTFIYHTHLHDHRQLPLGLYGPMIVVEPGETFDPATDHVLVLGRSSATPTEEAAPSPAVVLNGERAPRLVWKAGARHRVRLINITPDDILDVSLQAADGLLQWKPLAKDGAPVPSEDAPVRLARQTIAVGETYDFEYRAPEGRKDAWVDVRSTGGRWQVQGRLIVK